MSKIISEDATNIFFPQACDVLVDDVEQCKVVELNTVLVTLRGESLIAHRFVNYLTNEIKIYGKLINGT